MMASLPRVLPRQWARWPRTARTARATTTRPTPPAAPPRGLPATDPADVLAYSRLLVELFPQLRMPGPQRFDPTRGDWCICAVPLLWTDDNGWVHLADGRPCPMPRSEL